MNKQKQIKYPNSVNLFKFCRSVLDDKYGKSRVLDQDVGQILGFDPADCSHWKKGKKNIKNIEAIKKIASQLEIDEQTILDIALGRLSSSEALLEHFNQINTQIDTKLIEKETKKYYMSSNEEWTPQKEKNLYKFLEIPYQEIAEQVKVIHNKIKFKEAPLYLPEIVMSYPEIQIIQIEKEQTHKDPVFVKNSNDKHLIYYSVDQEMRPYIRYLIAKALSKYFMKEIPTPKGIDHNLEMKIKDLHHNIFAMILLVPSSLLEKELSKLDSRSDIITQLSEIFWVSKQFIKERLKVYTNENIDKNTTNRELFINSYPSERIFLDK